jgi:hypothetical protein
MTGDITVRPHTVSGTDQLNEAMALAYLEASGYGTEAEGLADAARKYAGTYHYTGDRHRYVAYIMPGGYWVAGDCTESEERIKALSANRRGGWRAGL